MKALRAYEILSKLRAIHEQFPYLAMTDISNEEIRLALSEGASALTIAEHMKGARTYPTMTISSADREIGQIIEKHRVYGVETVIRALVRAVLKSKDPRLMSAVFHMVNEAFRDESKKLN